MLCHFENKIVNVVLCYRFQKQTKNKQIFEAKTAFLRFLNDEKHILNKLELDFIFSI